MHISVKPVLQLISIRHLVDMMVMGQLGFRKFGRDAWPKNQKLEFLNNLKDSGIFQSIILLYSRLDPSASGTTPRYQVVDGTRRIDAVLDAFYRRTVTGPASDMLFDLRRNSFVAAGKAGASYMRIRPDDLLYEKEIRRKEELLYASIKAGSTGSTGQVALLPIRNLREISRLLDLQIPAYIVEDSYPDLSIFSDINSNGQPLRGRCPNGYQDCPKVFRKAEKFNSSTLINVPGLAGLGKKRTSPFQCADSVEVTSYASVFAGSDLQCRVSIVPRAIVDRLTVDLPRLEIYVASVLERADAVLELPPDGTLNPAYIRSASEELEDCIGCVLKDDGFYDGEILSRISRILPDFIFPLNRATASMSPPPEPLLLRMVEFSGVFVDRDIEVGQILCRAGIFIRENLNEEEQKRVIYHELAHAFFRTNKEKLLDCPWIEEGLAEWCSGYISGSFATASQFAFYDFLQVLEPLPLADVQAVANHWLRGDVPVSWWCSFVKNRKLPPGPRKVSAVGKPATSSATM